MSPSNAVTTATEIQTESPGDAGVAPEISMVEGKPAAPLFARFLREPKARTGLRAGVRNLG